MTFLDLFRSEDVLDDDKETDEHEHEWEILQWNDEQLFGGPVWEDGEIAYYIGCEVDIACTGEDCYRILSIAAQSSLKRVTVFPATIEEDIDVGDCPSRLRDWVRDLDEYGVSPPDQEVDDG